MEQVHVTNTDNPVDFPQEAVSDMTTEQLYQPQRLENESFADYKERRLVAKYKNQMNAKGKLFWNSKEQGTYQAKVAK